MHQFLGSTWWLIITLGLLVTFHEFGHFWVARRCGVKVLRFSVGFGRALWSHTAKSGTEYRIAMIPLGGYVKMLDAREGKVPQHLRHVEFTAQSIWKRIAIVLAGPGFNLIFAIAAFWLMFVIGRPGIAPIIDAPASHSMAAQAGFSKGDKLVRIDGQKVTTWDRALDILSENILTHRPSHIELINAHGQPQQLLLPLDQLPRHTDIEKAFTHIGLSPAALPPEVASTTPDSPAQAAGLQAGDIITAINGQSVHSFADIGVLIKEHAQTDKALDVNITRDKHTQSIKIIPEKINPGDKGGTRWIIGVRPPMPATTMVRYPPIAALGKAVYTTWDKTVTTFQMVWQMITGNVSTKNLSGIITIAQVANNSAAMGLAWFLSFLGLVSLSLAVLNLLPIPVLDGGHLLYYLIELIKGSPVSEGAMMVGQSIGLTLITALMGLALYNDILRLVS